MRPCCSCAEPPSDPDVTATWRGSATCSCESNAAPNPDGVNTSVWLLTSCQCPGVLGESRGRADPSTSLTGCENVRWSGVAGEICAPAAGRVTITGEREGGNQLTSVGGPTVSQRRAATATSVVPVCGCSAERDRALGGAERVAGDVAAAAVGDGADRFVEAHVHGRARVHRHPGVGHARDGRVQRELLGALGAECPAEPAGPADLDVHRDLLARAQPAQRRQAAVGEPSAESAARPARRR